MDDAFFMQRCLDLAHNGLGAVAPNPMVGAVIVHQGRIIGEGFHTACGMPHAEVEAIRQVKDESLLPASTLYVNLEPCSHHGRTPPCTELILGKMIGRIVIAQDDPNAEAAGGAEILRRSGVEVITGVMREEARHLNRRFNTWHEKQRPYLILKWAQTSDGFVDAIRTEGNEKPAWITDETCRMLVHKWRSEEQSILAGSNTILMDNPELNVRSWSGRNPLRVTIDRNGRLDGHFSVPVRILDGTISTLVYTHLAKESRPNVEFPIVAADRPVWPQIMADLYNRGIQSVLVEGGPTLLSSLISEGLWDEARVFIGPGWFGEGVRAPGLPFSPAEVMEVGNSKLFVFERERGES